MPRTLTCADCGKPMQQKPTSRPQGQARCNDCRKANPAPRKRKPDTRKRGPYGSKKGNCAECGKEIWRGSTSRPAGEARCQECRRTLPTVDASQRYSFNCEECGIQFRRAKKGARFCSTKCSGDYQSRTRQTRALDDPRVLRIHRETGAPGLSSQRRAKLRAKWKQQAKPCVYCGALATTIDHVLPLVRGGTNYEGNLAPCCHRCNSSKSGRTVIEWRHGVSLGRVREYADWMGKPPVVRKPKPKPAKVPREPHECPICQTPTTRLKYCSTECAIERERRYVRDKYRARSGLAVDPMQPTSKWAA